MKLPEQYKNLTFEQKKTVVANLLLNYGNNETKILVNNLGEDHINFLFKYFFTESREARERMWNEMLKEYEATLKDIERIAEKIQMLNLQYREFLSQQEDIKNFMKDK